MFLDSSTKPIVNFDFAVFLVSMVTHPCSYTNEETQRRISFYKPSAHLSSRYSNIYRQASTLKRHAIVAFASHESPAACTNLQCKQHNYQWRRVLYKEIPLGRVTSESSQQYIGVSKKNILSSSGGKDVKILFLKLIVLMIVYERSIDMLTLLII